MVTVNQARREGRAAWRNDVSPAACPYDEPRLREAWLDGWLECDKHDGPNQDD